MDTGLIDPEGGARGAAAADPAAGQPAILGPATDTLVMERGFVALAHGEGGMRLRLRPDLLSGPALARLCFVLADRQPPRVLVACFETGARQWRHEMCGDWLAAIRRLEQLRPAPRD